MKGKKFFSNWIVLNILGAIILFAALAVGTNIFLKSVTRHNQEIRVPDLSGMTAAEAEQYLSQRGMRSEVTDSVYIKRMERGVVYRQSSRQPCQER